jgi:hypothetical protein
MNVLFWTTTKQRHIKSFYFSFVRAFTFWYKKVMTSGYFIKSIVLLKVIQLFPTEDFANISFVCSLTAIFRSTNALQEIYSLIELKWRLSRPLSNMFEKCNTHWTQIENVLLLKGEISWKMESSTFNIQWVFWSWSLPVNVLYNVV